MHHKINPWKQCLQTIIVCAAMLGFSAPLSALSSIPEFGIGLGQFASSSTAIIGTHTDIFDLRLGGSYISTSAEETTTKTRFLVMAGTKDRWAPNLYLTYGFSYWKEMGQINDVNISDSFTIGFYFGLQYELTEKLLLDAQILPFTKSTTTFEDSTSTDTTTFFNHVSLGLTLLLFQTP